MKVLVMNCGSSSVKYTVLDMETEETLADGVVGRIGEESAVWTQRCEGIVTTRTLPISDHRQGLQLVLDSLTDQCTGVMEDLSEIAAAGHRVVHGGPYYVESTVIDDEVAKGIEECAALAPLHNPPNLVGIDVLRGLLPGIPHVAVFDTAFHQTIPEVAHLYAVPYEYYQRHGVRRYGFHGTSHRYVSQRAAEILGRDPAELRMITCHLGNGCSIAAVKGGRSVDTSMGFTPLEGIPMGTRSGDIDPSIMFHMAEKEHLTLAEIDDLLNKKSGFLGLSGVSNDMVQIKEAADKGNRRARLTIDVLAYRAKKYVGAYAAVLGGIDAVVFTGGIGENADYVRSKICRGLEFLGVHLDDNRNSNPSKRQGVVSAEHSSTKVLVIPTREELMIAQETSRAVRRVGRHSEQVDRPGPDGWMGVMGREGSWDI